MSRLQDSIIDDDEESCPLCIEEFDLTDKNFKPCPCGYQICQFCFNSLKNTYEKSTCPNCRRVYDEKTIQFKIPSKEDIVHDKENKARKQAATKRKEGEKRDVETSSRRNLAGVRVKQQNLVYVIGLVPSVKDESTLLQTLRGLQYFGQYGEIDKIVVSKSKPGSTSQGIGVYITYATKDAAALCIEVVDGSMNGDRVLRAQYGTTKYCSAYLRGETCSNKSCTFLHETGEEGQGTTLQNEPSRPKAISRSSYNNQASLSQPTVRNPQPATLPPLVTSQPMQRESSKENGKNPAHTTDASALPSTASWANKDTTGQPIKFRRPSQTAGNPTLSPQSANVAQLAKTIEEPVRQTEVVQTQAQQSATTLNMPRSEVSDEKGPMRLPSTERMSPTPAPPQNALFDQLVSNVNSPSFRFSFDDKAFTHDELAAIARCPTMIDPYGGAKRRLMREKEAERRQQQLEAQAKLQARSSSADPIPDEENIESGSLALGGEPEEGARNFSTRTAIQRPMLDASINSRSLTPQQRQQLAFLDAANMQQAPGQSHPAQQGFALGNHDDQQYTSIQNQHFDPSQSHARQSSRYSFANDSVKPNPAPRFSAQQQQQQQQQATSGPVHFYTSGVQGPPPGLKTAGTPPVSGGGMFAQGHGFTSNMNAGFGAAKDANAEMLMRDRSGAGSGHDAAKRGGVADLADPSILQARLHSTSGVAGQGLLGSRNLVDQDFPPLALTTKPQEASATSKSHIYSVQTSKGSPTRSTTPKVPPGLNLPHAHPLPFTDDNETTAKDRNSDSVTPVLPALPLAQRANVAKARRPENGENPEAARRNPRKNPNDSLPLIGKDGLGVTTADETTGRTVDPLTEKGTIKPAISLREPSRSRDQGAKSAKVEHPPGSNVMQESGSRINSGEKLLPRLDKLDISAAVGKSATSREALPKNSQKSIPHSTSSILSQADSVPDNPNASTMTKSPDRTSATRPRTLRLTGVTTPKPETAPASAATDRSGKFSAGILKQISRQASSSPIPRSHPSTPTVSEHGTSAAISRAGSPPISEKGSIAVERKKGKGTTKKERIAKSEAPSEPNNEGPAAPTPQPTEEVGPIISRQKKKKRQNQEKGRQAPSEAKSARDSKLQATETARNRNNDTRIHRASIHQDYSTREMCEAVDAVERGSSPSIHQSSDLLPSPMEETPVVGSTPRRSYTLNDLFNDASQLPDTKEAITELLNNSISPTSLLFREALDSNDVDLDSALFNAPPLNSYKLSYDPRKGAEYLEACGYSMVSPFAVIYLSGYERKQLYQGHAVRHFDSNKASNVLKRALITPNGAILRHLSAEEEDQVITLEDRLSAYEDEHGIAGKSEAKALDATDYMNLTGGLQGLMALPQHYKVGILMAEPGTEDAEDEEDDESDANGSDETDEMTPLASGFGATPEAPMKKPISPTTMNRRVEAATKINLRSMDVYKLQKRIRETQVEMEGSRKDAEALEKRAIRKAKDVGRWREAFLKEVTRNPGST